MGQAPRPASDQLARMASNHAVPDDISRTNTAPRQPEHGTMQEKADVVAQHDEKHADNNSGSSDTRVNGAPVAAASSAF